MKHRHVVGVVAHVEGRRSAHGAVDLVMTLLVRTQSWTGDVILAAEVAVATVCFFRRRRLCTFATSLFWYHNGTIYKSR